MEKFKSLFKISVPKLSSCRRNLRAERAPFAAAPFPPSVPGRVTYPSQPGDPTETSWKGIAMLRAAHNGQGKYLSRLEVATQLMGNVASHPMWKHREGRGLAARQPKGMVSSAAATRCYWPPGPQVCFPLCWTSSVLDHFSSLWRPLLSPHLLLGWRKECLPGTPRHLCLSERSEGEICSHPNEIHEKYTACLAFMEMESKRNALLLNCWSPAETMTSTLQYPLNT